MHHVGLTSNVIAKYGDLHGLFYDRWVKLPKNGACMHFETVALFFRIYSIRKVWDRHMSILYIVFDIITKLAIVE